MIAPNFCGLLRKAEFYNFRSFILHFIYTQSLLVDYLASLISSLSNIRKKPISANFFIQFEFIYPSFHQNTQLPGGLFSPFNIRKNYFRQLSCIVHLVLVPHGKRKKIGWPSFFHISIELNSFSGQGAVYNWYFVIKIVLTYCEKKLF